MDITGLRQRVNQEIKRQQQVITSAYSAKINDMEKNVKGSTGSALLLRDQKLQMLKNTINGLKREVEVLFNKAFSDLEYRINHYNSNTTGIISRHNYESGTSCGNSSSDTGNASVRCDWNRRGPSGTPITVSNVTLSFTWNPNLLKAIG